MEIKNKDFVEIEYTGKIKDMNQVFDTTDEATAKKENIYNEKMKYGPIVVCIGEKHLLPGLDSRLEGKEIGKEYDFDLSPDDGFGRKSASMLKLVPARVFKEQKIMPMPGLEINVDGMPGIIRTANGGRIIVDFNHPLASKELIYKVKVNKKIEDTKEKIKALLSIELNMKEPKVEHEKDTAKYIIKAKLPKNLEDPIKKRLMELISEVKDIEFKE
jgi:FKBP-type peptidyl-prolyl cis-trans isomerase 2